MKILPTYFKTKNYSSFVRQLNLYNFRKIKNPEGNIEFGHEKFRRDDVESLQLIVRKVGQDNELYKQKTKSGKPMSFEYNRLLGIIRNLENSLKSENHKNEQKNKENNELLKKLENSQKTCAKRTRKLMFIVWMISDNLDSELVLKIKALFCHNNLIIEDGMFDNFDESKIPRLLDERMLSSIDDSDFFIDQLLSLVTRFHNAKSKNKNNQVSIQNLLINFEENTNTGDSQRENYPCLMNQKPCALSDIYSQESDLINIFPSVCNLSVASAGNEEVEFVFQNTSSKSRMKSVHTTFEFEQEFEGLDFGFQPENFGTECKKPIFYKL